MENVRKNTYSHLTAKERLSMSFPARFLLQNKLLTNPLLDFGCGLGKDVEQLKEKGFDIDGYDPFYAPTFPVKKYETILCIYVLNVLLPEEQTQVIMDVSTLLNENGKAYFAVRRDIQHEGFRMHKIHQKQTYQCNVRLPFTSVFKNESCEIYQYQHYTLLHKGNGRVSPFFAEDELRKLVVESATAVAIFDKYPVSEGHSLILPKRVISNYFELTWREQMACWMMVNKVKHILQQLFKPDGFNVGINTGQAAGQTIPHAHIHVIPRYEGDVMNPRGGVRGVIADKMSY